MGAKYLNDTGRKIRLIILTSDEATIDFDRICYLCSKKNPPFKGGFLII